MKMANILKHSSENKPEKRREDLENERFLVHSSELFVGYHK